MRTTTDRARGVTLRKLDLTSILARIPVTGEETASTAFDPWALFERDGVLYVVNNEGVGYGVDDVQPLEIGIYVTTPGHIAVTPKFLVSLTADEIRPLITDEQIDLADLVRVFGARLEDNFWSWHAELAH